MTQTTNFQLNQWSENDYVRRADFNADNLRIDTALGNMAQVVLGTYTGDGTTLRTVELGFTPRAVYVTDARGAAFRYSSGVGRFCGGLAMRDKPAKDGGRTILAVCDNGFQVNKDTSSSPYIGTNYEGDEYYYVALR